MCATTMKIIPPPVQPTCVTHPRLTLGADVVAWYCLECDVVEAIFSYPPAIPE